MKSRIVCIFLCTVIVAGIFASLTQYLGLLSMNASGAGGLSDSPWPMFRQNLNHTGQSPYNTSGNNGELKWSFLTYGQVESSPSIDANGTIFVGSLDYKLYAINPDGTEKWNFTASNYIRSSPAIGSEGTIYVGSSDDKLYAINPDGTEKWNFITGGAIISSPTISSDEIIYVGSGDNKLYAINPDSSEGWSFETGNSIRSSPAISSNGMIYVGSWDNNLYAINPDGSEKWNFTTGGVICHSSPAIGSDGTIYFGSNDKKIYAINPDGTEKWRFTTNGGIVSSPAINSHGTIFVGSDDNKLYAIGTPNILPIADVGPDQTVYLGDEVHFNGSTSYDPDGTIVTYEWDFNASDGLWWETGAPPDAFGPDPNYTYTEYGTYIATLRVTDNNGSMDTDTCEISVLVPIPLPPTLYINVSLYGNDVILYWAPPSTLGIDH